MKERNVEPNCIRLEETCQRLNDLAEFVKGWRMGRKMQGEVDDIAKLLASLMRSLTLSCLIVTFLIK
jgi:hypothetical protein